MDGLRHDRPASELGESGASSSDARTCVLVCGMHRSGTSATSGLLGMLGAGLPRQMLPPNPANPKGYFESARLVAEHDAILASIDCHWNDWRPTPLETLSALERNRARDQLAALVEEEFGDAKVFVVKDPRLCRLLPLWREVLDKLRVRSVYLLPFRNPAEVANSLRVRDGSGIAQGLLLWLRYVLEAEAASRGERRWFVCYDNLLSEWRVALSPMLVAAGLDGFNDATLAAVDEFLNRPRRRTAESTDQGPVWPKRVFDAIVELAANPNERDAQARLDDLRQNVDAGCAIFQGLTQQLAEDCDHQVRAADARAADARAADAVKESEQIRAHVQRLMSIETEAALAYQARDEAVSREANARAVAEALKAGLDGAHQRAAASEARIIAVVQRAAADVAALREELTRFRQAALEEIAETATDLSMARARVSRLEGAAEKRELDALRDSQVEDAS